MKKIDQFSIRRQNMLRIWNMLMRGEPVTRQALADGANLSLMTVTNLVDLLDAQGVLSFATAVKEAVSGHKPAGRKAEILSINTRGHALLALDLTGVYFRRSALTLDAASMLPESVFPYDSKKSYVDNLNAFLLDTKRFIEKSVAPRALVGVAVVAPGPYSVGSDSVHNKRIPQLNAVRIKETVRAALGEADVFVEEDVKLALRAFLPRTDADLLYYVYIGEGVGGAAAYHGEVLRGLNAVTGDAGQVAGRDGVPYEERVSLRAFAALMGVETLGAQGEDELLVRLMESVKQNPGVYRARLLEAAGAVAEMLHTAVWMLDPEEIIVDCRYAAPFQADFIDAIQARLSALTQGSLPRAPRVLPVREGVRGVLEGAAQALTREWLERII